MNSPRPRRQPGAQAEEAGAVGAELHRQVAAHAVHDGAADRQAQPGAGAPARPAHEINQAGVSRVFQTPEIFGDLTLVENVMIPAFGRRDGSFRLNGWNPVRHKGPIHQRAMDMLADVGLAGKANDIASQLSRGDKRRLELALCLVQEPKLLLLDEPTAGMARADTNNTIDLLRKIAERGITMVVIEHDMHVVFSLADRISVLAQGTVIAEDLPRNIKGNPKVQEAYLGGAHL